VISGVPPTKRAQLAQGANLAKSRGGMEKGDFSYGFLGREK